MTELSKLGKTDIKVNPIGLGTNAVGGHNLYPNLDEEQGKDVVRAAIENGVTLLDTAFIYGPGRSEELVGEVVKEYNREDVVIATKGAHYFDGDETKLSNDPEFLKEQGKIKAIGVSNFSLEQLKEANKDGHVDVVQLEYNLLNRENEEILNYTAENNITFIPYFPLVSGLLAGKYDENTTFNDLRADNPEFQGERFKENLKKVDKLRDIAKEHNVEVAHIVLAFYLTKPSLDVIIPGAKRKDQVIDNLKTLDVKLTKENLDTIEKLFPVE